MSAFIDLTFYFWKFYALETTKANEIKIANVIRNFHWIIQNRNSSVLYANKFNEALDLFSREIFYCLRLKNRYPYFKASIFLILNGMHLEYLSYTDKMWTWLMSLLCYCFNILSMKRKTLTPILASI